MARFLAYAWITLGLIIFARAFCLPATIIMLSEMEWVWKEALGSVAALVPLAFVGWAWGSSWIGRPGHTRRSLRNLKYFALGHAACGLLLILVELVWITAFNRLPASGLLGAGFPAVFLDAIMLLFAPSVRAATPIILFYRRGLRIVSVAVPIGVMIWSLATIPIAARSAETLAGEEPYCIHRAEGTDYKIVASLRDLSGLNMQAQDDGDFFRTYYSLHAVLVVGTGDSARLFNWSHTQMTFDPLDRRYTNQVPDTLCQPRQHFIRTLPWF